MKNQPPHSHLLSVPRPREEIAALVAEEIAEWLAANPTGLADRLEAAASYDLADNDAMSCAHNLRHDLLRRIAARLRVAA